MIVEDDDDVRQSIADVLDDAGYQIQLASSGVEALALLERGSPLPHLVLIDLVMPLMDGAELRARLRAQPRFASLPMVFLTALHDRDRRLEALRGEHFLCKPVDLLELIGTVTQYAGPPPGRGAASHF
jgi:CheY-like chemotaxis protein